MTEPDPAISARVAALEAARLPERMATTEARLAQHDRELEEQRRFNEAVIKMDGRFDNVDTRLDDIMERVKDQAGVWKQRQARMTALGIALVGGSVGALIELVPHIH